MFVAICDIGSASFKYDMRRLTEILAFPKAWYRRSIARRMFLGDQSTGALYSDQGKKPRDNSSPQLFIISITLFLCTLFEDYFVWLIFFIYFRYIFVTVFVACLNY